MSGPYRGSCLCGEIVYEVDHVAEQIGHCHCSMCRKFHGAAFATLAEAPREHFHWISGDDLLLAYRADNGTVRQFCRCCGSSMTFSAPGSGQALVEFSLGTLDDPAPLYPDVHIYLDSKAGWYDPDEDLPRFSEGRGSCPVTRQS